MAGAITSATTNHMWSVRSRIGWNIVAHILLYGTVGYGGFDLEVKDPYLGNVGNPAFTGSTTVSGVVYGGGVEFMPIHHLLVRAELLSYTGDGSTLSTSMSVARVGVGYKF